MPIKKKALQEPTEDKPIDKPKRTYRKKNKEIEPPQVEEPKIEEVKKRGRKKVVIEKVVINDDEKINYNDSEEFTKWKTEWTLIFNEVENQHKILKELEEKKDILLKKMLNHIHKLKNEDQKYKPSYSIQDIENLIAEQSIDVDEPNEEELDEINEDDEIEI